MSNKVKVITAIIILVVVSSVSFYAGARRSYLLLWEASQRALEASNRADMANDRVKKVMAMYEALRATREGGVDSAKERAVASVDIISNDHDAVVVMWEDFIREYRGGVDGSGGSVR